MKPSKTKTLASTHNKVQASSHNGMFSAKIDPVSRNAIWKEHCLKEDSKLKFSTQFSINPSTLVYIAEKPTRYKPSICLTHEEIEEARRILDQVCIADPIDIDPTEKYDLPQTSSQEYGWCSRPLVETDPFFNYPHKGCPITKFAAKYEECMHRSPFAKRNPVDQHVAKNGTIDYADTGVNTSRIGSPSATSSAQASNFSTRLAKNQNKIPKPTPEIVPTNPSP